MTFESMIHEMKLHGVAEKIIHAIIEVCEQQGCVPQVIDAELRRYGYESIFSVDGYDFDEWSIGEGRPYRSSQIDD